MHTTEPNNDAMPPCVECGETAMPCECGRPIETVAQLERAVKAAGIGASVEELTCAAERKSSEDELPPCCREKREAEALAAKGGES